MTNNKPDILRLEDVSHRYGAADGPTAGPEVLRDVSLEVRTGESLAIVGPSGSGKSTMLNLMGCLDQPSGGRVIFDGTDVATLVANELAALRNQSIGFIFQSHHLLPQCSALENVLIPSLVNPQGRSDRPGVAARAEDLLKQAGLVDRMHHRPGALSGGERQRVAVVRALINEPKLVLADEPTGSLDGESADLVADMLVDLNKERGVTLIVVTHSMGIAERMDRTLHLRNGRLHENAEASR